MDLGDENAFPWDGVHAGGLTKREYFAALAMQAILSTDSFTVKRAAVEAVEAADCLIEALSDG